MSIKCSEGSKVVKEIHSDLSTNFGIWYVKKGKRKSILKFQEAGPGGLAEVRDRLDDSKVQFFLFRVTGIDVKAGAKSIRSKFVRGCFIGHGVGGLIRANAGILQNDVFTFLNDAHKSYQISSIDELTETVVEADLRAAAGAHQVQRFDFANTEARFSSKKPSASSPAPKAAPKAAPAAVEDDAVEDDAVEDDAAEDDAVEDDEEEAEAAPVTEAAPPTPAGGIKLTYFGAHGRGEAIRLILKAGGVDFEDERLTFADWPKMKGDPESVPAQLFGTLPVISHGDFKIGQSRAVQTYAAHVALPSTCATPQAAAIDAMFQNAHADVQGELYKCCFGSDDSKAAASAKINDSVAPHMKAIERILPDSGFIKGGDTPSAADIVIFDLGTSTLPDIKGLGVDLSPYPKFNALVTKVGAFPAIAEYVAERA